ncbi:hypothetical protein BH23GEM3_BH23GEM3_11290 [soil metagenome]
MELQVRPTLSDGVLLAMAEQIDPGIAGMDPRSFAARYLFPARRSLQAAARKPRRSPEKRRKEPGSPAPIVAEPPPVAAEPPRVAAEPAQAPPHEQIRAVFFEFARELAEAENYAAWVHVLTRADHYVERVVPLF